MNLWIGDYAGLRNEIYYLKFKLTDPQLSPAELTETQSLLDERIMREGKFRAILNAFKDIDNQILIRRYVDGESLSDIADVMGFSVGYTYQRHAKAMETIATFERVHAELERFKENFLSNRSK
ncbi:sigma factor-like helix-turn-helix DNA-binding protein [Sporosarcina cascadiensis]|uniref:sigma factor-like helix-turn-helix DNA-binding protein n=1 Tax=Sporosarcina cascadiensis TaxID=2660747 RepID=UPI00129B97A2|nr:sigma factor-like helix-turn-helix DNA-binding protein [Sporosarcina cascadiensis]